jgi:hypothetical protein
MGRDFWRRKLILGAQHDGERGGVEGWRRERKKRAPEALASTRRANRFRAGPGKLLAARIARAANRMRGAERKGSERNMPRRSGRRVRASHRCGHRMAAVLTHCGSVGGRARRCRLLLAAAERRCQRAGCVARRRPRGRREQKARQHGRHGFLHAHRGPLYAQPRWLALKMESHKTLGASIRLWPVGASCCQIFEDLPDHLALG